MGFTTEVDRLSEKVSWRVVTRFGGPTCLSVAAFAAGTAALALVGGGLLLAFADFAMTEVAGRHRRRDRMRLRVEGLLEVARDMLSASGSENVRVNVMLVHGDELRVEYDGGGYAADEIKEPWKKGNGCAGMAWEQRRVVLGALDKTDKETAEAQLQGAGVKVKVLAPRSVIGAEEIGSVMSVPIRNPAGKFVGVLNVDDRLNLPTSALAKREVVRTFELLANRLCEALAYAG